MSKQKIEIEIDVPDGFEFDRWGKPKEGDDFVYNGANGVRKAECNYLSEHLILKPTAPELDEKLREALGYLRHNNCQGCLFGCILFTCDAHDGDGCRIPNGDIDYLLSKRKEIIAEAARLKQQREDEAIELERKRVVGKWCIMIEKSDSPNKRQNRIGMVVDYASNADYGYKEQTDDPKCLWFNAIPLTPDQLTALGLEND